MRTNLASVFPAIKRKIEGKKLIYLDSACTALKNAASVKAQERSLIEEGFCAGARSFNAASILAQERFVSARAKIAASLNAKESEIIFCSGTTEAANLIAKAFPFKEGDEIFLSSLEHNSVFLPFWKIAKEKKLRLRIIPLKNYKADLEYFSQKVGSRTRLLCLTMASNLTGGQEAFSAFSSFCQKRGIKLFLDAAQYLSSHEFDFKKTGSDFVAFSGHKLSAPFGIGALVVKESNFKFLKSPKLGGGTLVKIVKDGFNYKPALLENNASFEAGIQNYAGVCALAETFSVMEKLGKAKIRKHLSGLSQFAKKKLDGIDGIRVLGSDHAEGALVSFVFEKNLSPADFQLYAMGVKDVSLAFRTGKMCADLACLELAIEGAARISFGYYNEEKDIEIFVQILKDFLRNS